MQFLFAQTIEISCTHHNRLILDNITEKFAEPTCNTYFIINNGSETLLALYIIKILNRVSL